MKAGRLFLAQLAENVNKRQTFSFETTMSGRSHLKFLFGLKKSGWRVQIIFLALADIEVSRTRVAERVKSGGHDIPQEILERRFDKCVRNYLNHYIHCADKSICLENSLVYPRAIFRQDDEQRTILDRQLYYQLLDQTQP